MDESKSDSDSEASRSPVDYKENEGSQSSSHESNESDNEQNYSNEKNDPNSTTARALFGDADDISTEEEDEEDNVDGDGKSVSNQDVFQHSTNESIDQSMDFEMEQTNQLNNMQEFEYDQNDEDPDDEEHDIKSGIDKDLEPEPEPDPVIEVEIPKIMTDLGRELHFVKLPNFLSIDTRPFDPDTYEDEIDEEETLDEEGRARLKLKVENTIRWREITNDLGGKKRESNTRLVRWSDGSLSLHLGSEIFDVYKQPLQGDHNHLFIRQGTGLQGQAVFRTKLSFRPHSTESFTHRKMTLSLADRSQKVSGIKILSTIGNNPEQDRHILLKREEEKLKQTIRASKPRRKDVLNRSHNISRTYHEEEGSDEDGAISLAAIKNKYKSGTVNKTGTIYSSEEEDSDIEPIRSKKGDKSRALRNLESDSD